MIRKVTSHSPSGERWLVSYADFLTLLFAFFVVLFASSQADRSKAKRVSEAVERAFDGPHRDHVKTTTLPDARSALPSLEPARRLLDDQLQEKIRTGKMQVRMEQRGLVISLSQATFFPSGGESLEPSTFGSLEKVALAIRLLPNPIRAEGHTDSVPIHTLRFQNNWELASARAISVMELLRDRWRVPQDRLAVSGFADTIPVDSNLTEEGRAKNRRVDIVVLNRAESESRDPR